MSRKKTEQSLPDPDEKVRTQLLAAIKETALLCRGTVLKRTKLCGKPSCRCAQDPKARHGPYYEWGRMVRERLVHTMISPQQARAILRAIRNYRRIERLLRRWEASSAKILLAMRRRKRS